MVKFSKQFEGQLVPEWKEAFVDYWQLKKDLKKIHLLNINNNNINNGSISNTGTINKNQQHPSLANSLISSIGKLSLFGHHHHRDHGPIHVHKKLASSVSKGDMYETELLEQFADTDAAKEFFACLDTQLNKVNQFYKAKENEFMDRGDSLKKQMEILIELNTAIKQHRGNKGASSEQDTKEDASISGTISCEEESIKDRTEQEQQLQDNNTPDDLEINDESFADSSRFEEDMEGKSIRMKKDDNKIRTLSGRVFNCQGKKLRLNIPLTTPSRTFSAMSSVLEDLVYQSSKKNHEGNNNKLHINKTKLHHAEKMIKKALIELYKGLGYLKTYRNLNMLAFIKILKKFDKVTGKQILPIYLKVVESSYFNSSDKVMNLADEVEELFVKHFAEDNKRTALKYLRPHQRKESHSVTFFIGLFTGCFIALLAGYVIMAQITGMYRPQPDTVYMETVYPVLRQVTILR
ncbi:hypothetical protein QYF36_019021 [Acer negundo]|nr:hypothetical protein QYF36_019021 [Acer negundo]